MTGGNLQECFSKEGISLLTLSVSLSVLQGRCFICPLSNNKTDHVEDDSKAFKLDGLEREGLKIFV
jgi:hypothetical protein